MGARLGQRWLRERDALPARRRCGIPEHPERRRCDRRLSEDLHQRRRDDVRGRSDIQLEIVSGRLPLRARPPPESRKVTTLAFSLRRVEQERGGRRTLCGVDLDLPAREVVALVGPSGAGKTSLLRLLNRLDDPTRGSVDFQGAPITGVPVRELRRRVAFVFQAPVMFPGTVGANLDLARTLGPTTIRTSTTSDALRFAGLDESFLNRDAEGLSGGEKQ